MANQRASGPGRLQGYEPQAQIRDVTVDMPAGGAFAFERAAQTFANLGARLGQLADKAAAREGQEAGVTDALSAALPGEAGGKLKPRRDGTIRGDAYDAAAIDAYSARVDTKLRGDVADAYDAHRDDPQGFEAALAKVKAAMLPDLGGDPDLTAAFTKRFDDQAFAYRRDIEQRQQQRVLEERQVALDEQLTAVRLDLERRAELSGGGDPALLRDMENFSRTLQQQVDEGVLTPKQAYAYRRDMATATAAGRVRGLARSMGASGRIAFADSLDEAYMKGDPALAGLDRDEVGRVASEIRSTAAREIAERHTAATAATTRLKAFLPDDLASIEATGQPLAFDGKALSIEQIAGVLGPEDAKAYAVKRAAARLYFDATSDLALLPEAGIAERLASLTPKAGTPGFKAQEDLAQKVATKAEAVLKARAADPAAAVDPSIDPNLTDESRVDACLAAQDALGIPGYVRAPLTKREIGELTGPVEAAGAADETRAIQTMLETIKGRYGKHAEGVLNQVLRVKGLDAEAAEVGARLWRKLNAGEAPTSRERSLAVVIDETAKAAKALGGDVATPQAETPLPAQPAPGQLRPVRQQAIQMLKANPALAGDFNTKYGPGTAEYYLGAIAGARAAGAP